MIDKGKEKIDKILDYKTIVRDHHLLWTLLRTQMTAKQRKLMILQRRSLVLENVDSDDEEYDIEVCRHDFVNKLLDDD